MAALVSAAACLVVAATAQSLAGLIAPVAVAGAANALCQPAANLLIARAVPVHRQGFAFAVKQAAVPFSTLLAGAAVPAAGPHRRVALGLRRRRGAGAASGRGASARRRAAGRRRAARTGSPSGGGSDVPFPVMAMLAVGIGFGAAAGGTLGSFLVSAAGRRRRCRRAPPAGSSPAARSPASPCASSPAAGRPARRRSPPGRGAHAGCSAPAPSPSWRPPGRWRYVVAGPLGFCTAWAWPGLFNLAVVRANPTRPAAATGITQTGTYIGAVSGPLLFGVIADHAGFRTAWLVAVGFAVLAAAAMHAAAPDCAPGSQARSWKPLSVSRPTRRRARSGGRGRARRRRRRR